jgi:uncharacterized protein YdhG (YjbR/CyaY superfamily)
MAAGSPAQADAYLARVPEPFRSALERLRRQIRAAAPDAQEGFGYGIPGFYLDGPLFYYGAAKAHCGLYGAIPAAQAKELAGFAHSKGTIRFTPDRPLPAALVRRLVKARVAENKARLAAKKPSRPRAKR